MLPGVPHALPGVQYTPCPQQPAWRALVTAACMHHDHMLTQCWQTPDPHVDRWLSIADADMSLHKRLCLAS